MPYFVLAATYICLEVAKPVSTVGIFSEGGLLYAFPLQKFSAEAERRLLIINALLVVSSLRRRYKQRMYRTNPQINVYRGQTSRLHMLADAVIEFLDRCARVEALPTNSATAHYYFRHINNSLAKEFSLVLRYICVQKFRHRSVCMDLLYNSYVSVLDCRNLIGQRDSGKTVKAENINNGVGPKHKTCFTFRPVVMQLPLVIDDQIWVMLLRASVRRRRRGLYILLALLRGSSDQVTRCTTRHKRSLASVMRFRYKCSPVELTA